MPAIPRKATGNTVPAIRSSSTPCLCPQVPITWHTKDIPITAQMKQIEFKNDRILKTPLFWEVDLANC